MIIGELKYEHGIVTRLPGVEHGQKCQRRIFPSSEKAHRRRLERPGLGGCEFVTGLCGLHEDKDIATIITDMEFAHAVPGIRQFFLYDHLVFDLVVIVQDKKPQYINLE